MVTRSSSLFKLLCLFLLVIYGTSFAKEIQEQKIIVLDSVEPIHDHQSDQIHPLPTTSLLEEMSSKETLQLTIKEKIGNLRDFLTETLGEDNHRDEKGYLPQFSYIYDLFFDTAGKQKRDRLRLLLSKANVTFALFDQKDVEDLEHLSTSYQNGLCVPGFSFSLWTRCYAPPTNCASVKELISSLIGDIKALDSIDKEKIGISSQKNSLSLRFLTDHIPMSGRATPNQDVQLKLIDRGYEILKEIRENKVTHKEEPVIFTADFIKTYSSWWSFFCPQTALGATLSLLTWSNHKKETLFRRAYLEDIVALQWAVTNEAYLKGYFFKSGSFTFIDNDLKFYKYFEDYIKCASGITDIVDLPWGIFNLGSLNTRSYFVYDRSLLSSHYKQKSLSQSGIDIRFESNQYVVPVLPYGMAHLIVGRIAAPDQKIVTFLKPELQGLGDWYNAWLHGKEYFSYESAGGPKGNSEKTVPQNVLKAFCDLYDHIPEEDKSSIPNLSDALNLTKEIKSKSSLGEYNVKNLRSSKLSVSQIFHFLRAIYSKYEKNFEKEKYDVDNPQTLQDFTYVLAHSLQMWSNLSSRSGSEVIFDFDKGMTELKEELFPSRNKLDAASLIPFDEKKQSSKHDLQLSSVIQDRDLSDNHQFQFAPQSPNWGLRKVKRSKSTPIICALEFSDEFSVSGGEQESPVISKRPFLMPNEKHLPQKPLYPIPSITPQRTALLSSIREKGGGQGTQFLKKVDLTEILRKKEEEKQKREMFKRQITSGSQLHKVDHVEVRKAKEKAKEQHKKEAGPTLLDQIVEGTTLRKTPKS